MTTGRRTGGLTSMAGIFRKILADIEAVRPEPDGTRLPGEAEPDPGPVCEVCGGSGWVRRDVPLHDRDFGRAFPCVCQESKQQERAERLAGLPKMLRRYTFDTIKPREDDGFSTAVEEVFRFAAGGCEEQWLTIVGGLGWAKTHLALAALNWRIDHPEAGRAGRYVRCPQFLRDLRAGFADDSDHQVLREYQEVPLLVLDDVGSEYHRRGPKFPGSESVPAMDWADEQLFQLLDHRYLYRMETIITSNADPANIEARIRDRILDTGSGLVRIVSRDIESYRTRRRPE